MTMPLFDTEYEVDRDPGKMSYEAIFETGERLMISPHLCSSHDPEPMEHGFVDHRGLIDCTILSRVPMPNPLHMLGFGGDPIIEGWAPVSWTIDLDMASALIEGLSEVGAWAKLNGETDLEAYDPGNNPRIDIEEETDHHDLEEG